MISYITELNSDTHLSFIQNNKNVFLLVKAPWCQSCAAMMPTIEMLSSEMVNDVSFAIIDADQNQSYVMEMGVRNLPTSFLYKDGIEIDKLIGPKPKSGLIEFINKKDG